LLKADAVAGLHRIGRAEDRRHDRDDVHQRHADDAQHVAPVWLVNASTIGVFGSSPRLSLLGERGRLVDLAADDVARDDDDEAEQEGMRQPQELKSPRACSGRAAGSTAAARICPAARPAA
jgi:hypothetical protein